MRATRRPTGPVKDYSAKNTATGTKTDTPLKEIPQSISVVGAEQIRDQGAHNIQEALRYVPGVVADAYGVDGRADGHFIRGTSSTDYLDGLKRTYSYYTYTYRVDPYFLERIEVLKGPASVLYGQAPVGGIINQVSKRPQTEQGGEITVEYGTFDFKQVKFDMTGPVSSDGRWSYRLTGTARDAGTQVDNVDDDRTAIQPSITFRPDSDTICHGDRTFPARPHGAGLAVLSVCRHALSQCRTAGGSRAIRSSASRTIITTRMRTASRYCSSTSLRPG